MALEKLTAKDKSPVIGLLRAYWKSRGISEYGKTWMQNYLRKGHSTEIFSDEFFVWKEKKSLIGTVSLVCFEGDVAEIRDLVVKESFRSKGFGSKMLTEITKLAKSKKIRKLYALVLPETEKFYAAAGFEKEGTLKNHFQKGEHLSFMSLFL